jgi:hypothetical protein
MGRRKFLKLTAGLAGALSLPEFGPMLIQDMTAFTVKNFRTLSIYTARNCVSGPDWVRPGGPYYEMYTRDSFWIVQALRDMDLSARAYKRIAAQQYLNGQIPSLISPDGSRDRKDDESTILFIIWSYLIWKAGARPAEPPIFKAWAYLDGQVKKGKYVTGSGTYHYWLDTLAFGKPDTVSYAQGLYSLAARCAKQMGLEPSAAKITAAEQAYRGLFKPEIGAITLSENTDFLDVSCLAGEYLSLHILKEPILPDDVVRATVGSFSPVYYPEGDFLGYMVTSMLSGEYLDPSWLPESPDNVYGEYQNGGSWLLYDSLALGAAALHGDPDAKSLLLARFASEVRTERHLHEYLSTHPYSPHYGVGPSFRRDYGWSSFAHLVGEKLGLPDDETIYTPRIYPPLEDD